jgi:hypothetical protein
MQGNIQPLSIDALCALFEELKEPNHDQRVKLPTFAVLCFKHGAQRAAERLAAAGIRTVLSLRADVTNEDGVRTFLAALRPALEAVQVPRSLSDVEASTRERAMSVT